MLSFPRSVRTTARSWVIRYAAAAPFTWLADADRLLSEWSLADLLFKVRNGLPRYNHDNSGQELAASGVALLDPDDTGWGDDIARWTEEGLDRIRSAHGDRLSGILREEAEEIADRLLSVFWDISARAPMTRDAVGDFLACLLNREVLLKKISTSPDMGSPSPMPAARLLRAERCASIEGALVAAGFVVDLSEVFPIPRRGI